MFSISRFFSLVSVLTFLFWARPVFSVEIQQVISPLGIKSWLVEDYENPIITVDFAFRGGTTLDPEGKEGLANFVSALLDKGAGTLDSKAFQTQLEDNSIFLTFDAERDNFSGSIQTITRNHARAFQLLKLALTKPRFDREAVERIRSQILMGLKADRENPDRVAGQILFRALFPNHPYGRAPRGTIETVPTIKIEDMELLVAKRFGRDNLVLSVVGDITPLRLKTAIDEVFGDLKENAEPWKLKEARLKESNKTLLIEKRIPQSVIRFAQEAVKRDDPDFYSAYVMNYVLGGGGFVSRLYQEVREKRGLAYSVFSYLHPFKAVGLILGGAGTANKRVGETLKVLREEWHRMSEKGLSKEELENAKKFLTGSYPLRFTSSRNIASMLTGIQLERLGTNYIHERNSMINNVSLEDVKRVAKKILDVEKLTLVVVGNPGKLMP